MHESCSHCDIRKTSLFEINQQLGAQMENLRAENENLRSMLKYYENSDLVDVVRCKDCKYFSDFQHCGVLGFCEPHDYCSRGERRKEDGSIY